MEKLPMNKKKATLLKTWKRRFFRAADGWLHYYEVLEKDPVFVIKMCCPSHYTLCFQTKVMRIVREPSFLFF